MPLLALAALGAIVVFAAGLLVSGSTKPSQARTDLYRGSEPPAGITLPDFDLPLADGGRVSSRELRGRIVLLTLLDSQCADVCPILASVIARTVDRLSPEQRNGVRVLAVSGDPAEDTPASVRRFLAAQNATGRVDYLIGKEKELRPLWSALHLLPSLDTGRDAVHSAPLRIYDRDSVWVATLHAGADLSEDNLLHDIRSALAAGNETSG